MNRPNPLILAVALVATAAGPFAAEWSRFRGPDGAGVAEAPLVPAAPTEKDIAWKFELPGKGHSSPIAWGKNLFITAEDAAKAGTRYVLCLDASTGREKWRYADEFEVYPQHKFNSYAASTPAADARAVYISWLSGKTKRVLALDHAGKKLWQEDIGFYQEDHGGSSSPIVHEGLVIVPNEHCNGEDAAIFALDAASGAVKWKYETPTPKTAFSTPIVIAGPDGKKQLIVSSCPAALTALDPLTGKKLWDYRKEVNGSRAVGSPVWADGVIFASVGQGGNGMSCVAVRPGSADGRTKPELAWEQSKRIPYVPTPVAVGPNFYYLTDGGLVSCVKASSGDKPWADERGPGAAYSSPVCVNGRLVLLSRDGTLMTCTAGEKFEALGRMSLGEECQTTPAVADGRLIVRTNTRLIAIGGGTSSAKP